MTWFLMIIFTTHFTFVGPFATEKNCQDLKDLMFRGHHSSLRRRKTTMERSRSITPYARAVIEEIAALRGVDPNKIANPCRAPKVYRARIEVAKRLSDRGYSTTRIGQMLNHDHTTIVFYLGRAKKKPARPVWQKPKVRTLCVIAQRRPPPPVRKLYLKPYAGADMTEYQWKPREERL
jgi:hypothetical protein